MRKLGIEKKIFMKDIDNIQKTRYNYINRKIY